MEGIAGIYWVYKVETTVTCYNEDIGNGHT